MESDINYINLRIIAKKKRVEREIKKRIDRKERWLWIIVIGIKFYKGVVRNSIVLEKLETGKRIIRVKIRRGVKYKTLCPSRYNVLGSVHICHKGKERGRRRRTTPRTLEWKERTRNFNWTLYHPHYSSIRPSWKSQQRTQKIINRKRSQKSRRS